MELTRVYVLWYWQQCPPYSSGNGISITVQTMVLVLSCEQWHWHYNAGNFDSKGVYVTVLAMVLYCQHVLAVVYSTDKNMSVKQFKDVYCEAYAVMSLCQQ